MRMDSDTKAEASLAELAGPADLADLAAIVALAMVAFVIFAHPKSAATATLSHSRCFTLSSFKNVGDVDNFYLFIQVKDLINDLISN